MNRINLVGLLTVAITGAVSVGVSQGYFMVDKKINLAQKYDSLVTIARGPTPLPDPNQSLVAGIRSNATPTPENTTGAINYTNLFMAKQPLGLATAELFSKERLQPFIAEYSKPPVLNELRLTLPTTSIPRIDLVEKYTTIPVLHGSDLLAVLTIAPEYQGAAAKTLLTALDTSLTTYKQLGTTPDLTVVLEEQAGIVAALHKNMQLFANAQADTVGAMIGADQLVKLAPVLDEHTLALQKILTTPEDEAPCGLCVSSDELLENSFSSPAAEPSPNPL